jgi:hypothetical protein
MITPKYFPPLPVLVKMRNPGTIAKQRHQLLAMNGKKNLRVPFPPHKNIASKLKDFVNIERNPDLDEVITDVIISTINNNI